MFNPVKSLQNPYGTQPCCIKTNQITSFVVSTCWKLHWNPAEHGTFGCPRGQVSLPLVVLGMCRFSQTASVPRWTSIRWTKKWLLAFGWKEVVEPSYGQRFTNWLQAIASQYFRQLQVNRNLVFWPFCLVEYNITNFRWFIGRFKSWPPKLEKRHAAHFSFYTKPHWWIVFPIIFLSISQ